VIINEIRANEPGSDTAGEFVEIVNIGATAANIGGWTISDGTAVRHTFAAGTTLNPGKAVVVFGGASAIPAGLSNAVGASSGGLSLNNSGDTVTVRDSGGVVRNSFAYTSALAGTDGVSMNRNPDGTAAGAFVLHTSISSAQSSPGVRASSAPW
jgi:Lamin Tail Domain